MLPTMKRLWLPVAFSCLALSLVASEKPFPGDEEVAAFFRDQTARVAAHCLANVKSLEDWKAQREEDRRQLQEMLGLWPMPPRTELKPVVTGRLEQTSFTVEKVYFQPSPHLYVTADLYLPKNLARPAPAILFECGHLHMMTNGVSLGNKTAYQQHGAWFAQNGYVCLILDSLQLGEIRGIHTGTRDLGMWWWNSRGYTPAGVEAWFGIRGLDYLATRPEVDMNRIGVTGHSGGGWYSWMIAALDDRIKAAAPLAGMTDLRNQVVDGRLDSNCDCMFFLNTYRWDSAELAALIAPRPLLIGSEDKDRLFPLDGVLRIYEKTRRIYQLYGAANNLGLNIVEGPHADSPDFYLPVLRWFNRHLKGEDPAIESLPRDYFNPQELTVFAHLPADAVNTNIQKTFVPMAKPAPMAATAQERRPQEQAWLNEVRKLCFGGWPSDSAPLDLKRVFSAKRDGVRFEALDFTSQALVRLRLYVAHPAASDIAGPLTLHVLDQSAWKSWLGAMRAGFASELTRELDASTDGNSQAAEQGFEALMKKLAAAKGTSIWVAPRGIGLTAWNSTGKRESRIRRRFMMLGQTRDGMRVWDIRRAIQALRSIPGLETARLSLRASGVMGINALYAALFEPGVARLELSALPESHVDGPTYFNVLKIWDIPQALQTARDRMEVEVSQPK